MATHFHSTAYLNVLIVCLNRKRLHGLVLIPRDPAVIQRLHTISPSTRPTDCLVQQQCYRSTCMRLNDMVVGVASSMTIILLSE